MEVSCSRCGAELLGAVNRCWRCGQPVLSRSDGTDSPPVRRPPLRGPLDVPPWRPLDAEVLVVGPEGGGTEERNAAGERAAGVGERRADEGGEGGEGGESRAAGGASGERHVRRGSPFAGGAAESTGESAASRWSVVRFWRRRSDRESPRGLERPSVGPDGTPAAAERSQSSVGFWTAVSAIGLGGGALSLGDYPEAAFGVSTVALLAAVGAVALRRSLTTGLAVLVCLLLFGWTGFQLGTTWYERAYGRSLWSDEDGLFDSEAEFEPAP